MNNFEQQRLLDIKTAAHYLCMSEAALRKNIFLRRFNNVLVRIGGRIYFDREKLDQLLDELTLKGTRRES